jgi:hypothetical protein
MGLLVFFYFYIYARKGLRLTRRFATRFTFHFFKGHYSYFENTAAVLKVNCTKLHDQMGGWTFQAAELSKSSEMRHFEKKYLF